MKNYDNDYVYGSTAPQRNYAAPQRRYAQPVQEPAREPRRSPRQNQRSLAMPVRIDLPYLIVLILASLAALFILCSYLQIESSITTRIKNIEAQEKMLESLRVENDALESIINTSVNLDYVYEVATKELGMVYASRDQIIRYDRTEREHVIQNEDIPQ